jgi:hypothetical protein
MCSIYIIHSICGFPVNHFCHTNQQYVDALPVAFTKSQFFAHLMLLENTYIVFGGYRLNTSLRFTHSKNCIRKSIANFCSSRIILIPFSRNSVAIENGGFVIMSPCQESIKSDHRKSRCSPYPRSIRSDEVTL